MWNAAREIYGNSHIESTVPELANLGSVCYDSASMPIAIALSSGTFYPHKERVREAFRLAADHGYDGVEIIVDANPASHEPRRIEQLSADSGVPVLALHAPFPTREPSAWRGDSPHTPLSAAELLRRCGNLAGTVGARAVVVHIPEKRYPRWVLRFRGKMVFALPCRSRFGAELYRMLADGSLSKLEAETGVRICVENMPRVLFFGPSSFVWHGTPEQWATVHRHLTLDTTHFASWGIDPSHPLRLAQAAVRHVHLSDYRRGAQHLPAGDGDLPLTNVLSELAGVDQREPADRIVTVELTGAVLPRVGTEKLERTIADQIRFCRDALNRADGVGGRSDGAT